MAAVAVDFCLRKLPADANAKMHTTTTNLSNRTKTPHAHIRDYAEDGETRIDFEMNDFFLFSFTSAALNLDVSFIEHRVLILLGFFFSSGITQRPFIYLSITVLGLKR